MVTAFNRAGYLKDCIDSCLAQTFSDFEVIVVDDGSTDGTQPLLRTIADPRLRAITHESNRGINPSRHTGVANARGEWVVVVDSDWSLYPHSLQRLRDIIERLPPSVRVVRSRLLLDTGERWPHFVPEGPVDYRGRIVFAEAEGGFDAGRCLHRDVFSATPYFSDRRGAMETLYELDLAARELALYVPDVLGMQRTDAANSYLRSVDRKELIRGSCATLPTCSGWLKRHLPGTVRRWPRTAPVNIARCCGWLSLRPFSQGRDDAGCATRRSCRGRSG